MCFSPGVRDFFCSFPIYLDVTNIVALEVHTHCMLLCNIYIWHDIFVWYGQKAKIYDKTGSHNRVKEYIYNNNYKL